MFKLEDQKTSIKSLLLLILIAYLFSIGMRMIWVQEASATSQFYWNNELMISTNDGYYFAEGARDIINGHHEENDLSPIDSSMSKLTVLLSKIIPVSFETLILYMPSFLGSLIVIPLILIGRALNQTTVGFIAALIGSIAHSYYNRTMTGYYDTDMLNIVFPVLEIYSLVLALTHQRNRYLIPISISIALYQWWYPQAYALDSALFALIILYALLFDRYNVYIYKIALFILIGILSLPLISKLAISLIIFAVFHYYKDLNVKMFIGIFTSIIGLYLFTGGIDPIVTLLNAYVFRGNTENTIATSLHYYNVMATVREAGDIPFTIFAERISGHTITFIAACIGYIMAIIAYRPLLVTLPLVGLGFLAMSSGLRFTIYAVPMLAIGLGYLIVYVGNFIQITWLKYGTIALFTAMALFPNYIHIKEYLIPSVMLDQEVSALSELEKIASRDDYVVGWWDYGYPIRYYANVKTWVDGGKHTGDVNFPTSFALTASDSLAVANMLRSYTEYTEQSFREANKTTNDFEYMMEKQGFKEPNDFLSALTLPQYNRPKKTRDVFLYLPLRMMEIFPTVKLFSNLDLTTGENLPQPFFYPTRYFQDTGSAIDLGNGVTIQKQNSTLKIGNQLIPIKQFYQVGYDQNQKLAVNKQTFASEGLTVIFMASYGQFLVMEESYFNSAYIQMFVFENYDPNLFEPVIISPMTKIYKLKI